jgi:hypothetical protein
MHASYETMAASDVEALVAAMTGYYGSALTCQRDGSYILA